MKCEFCGREADVKRLHLEPDDVVVVRFKSKAPPGAIHELAEMFPSNGVLILDGETSIGVAGKPLDQPPIIVDQFPEGGQL